MPERRFGSALGSACGPSAVSPNTSERFRPVNLPDQFPRVQLVEVGV